MTIIDKGVHVGPDFCDNSFGRSAVYSRHGIEQPQNFTERAGGLVGACVELLNQFVEELHVSHQGFQQKAVMLSNSTLESTSQFGCLGLRAASG